MSKIKIFSIAFINLFISFNCFANPQGGHVVSGQANITTSPNYTQINQTTDKAIINWQSFNINANEHTHFQQPSSMAATLNRINANNGISQIFGHLTATGHVFLINPAGILFGPSAHIDVAGLVATTANIGDTDFMNGHLHFNQSALYPTTSVINQGLITARDGGLVALVAPGVENSGIIQANLGRVSLASGTQFTIDLYGDELIQLAVGSKITQTPKNHLGQTMANAVSNKGTIFAHGGTIQLTAQAAKGIVDNVINLNGVAKVSHAYRAEGKIVLGGGNSGRVYVSGKAEAKGHTGGTISISGEEVVIDDSLDTSGTHSGGNIFIGGTMVGGGPIPNAFNINIGPNARIQANATVSGNGGQVIVYANNHLDFLGTIEAKGGPQGGNGGFVETSGHSVNISGARVIASSKLGKAGTWLIDPTNFVIDSSNDDEISDALASSDVLIQTESDGSDDGDIIFASTAFVSWSSNQTFTVRAHDDVIFHEDSFVSNTGNGLFFIRTDLDGNNDGRVKFCSSDTHILSAGQVLIHYNPSNYPYQDDFSENIALIDAGELSSFMLVNDIYQLQQIEDNLSDKYILGKDIDAEITVEWGEGIETGYGFNPLGNPGNPFTGIFDGDGHFIYDLYISRSYEDYVGLFGFAVGAHIENVILSDAYIEGDDNVGGIVGFLAGPGTSIFMSPLTVENTQVTGEVYGDTNVGGIVGHNLNDRVLNNINWADVYGENNVGGIVGFNEAAGIVPFFDFGEFDFNENIIQEALVQGNTNFGSISGENSYRNVGGIVGWNLATAVSTDFLDDFGFGFDVDHEIDNIQTITAKAIVNNNDNFESISLYQAYNVGGIVGLNQATPPLVIQAFSDDFVTQAFIQQTEVTNGKNYAAITSESGYNTGGIVGANAISPEWYDEGEFPWGFSSELNLTELDLTRAHISDHENYGSISGYTNVGGIVGYNTSPGLLLGLSPMIGTIQYSTNYNNVYGYKNVGGIVGHNINDSVIYNTNAEGATIYGSINAGGIVGLNEAAGLIPYFDIEDILEFGESLTQTALVENNENYGSLSGGAQFYQNIGGIVGWNLATAVSTDFLENYEEDYFDNEFDLLDLSHQILSRAVVNNNTSYANIELYNATNVGGLVGLNQATPPLTLTTDFNDTAYNQLFTQQAEVTHGTNHGDIEISDYQPYGNNTGGIVGANIISPDSNFQDNLPWGFHANLNLSIYALTKAHVSNNTNHGYIESYKNVGGIIGFNSTPGALLGATTPQYGTVEANVNHGNVYGSIKVGGIVGHNINDAVIVNTNHGYIYGQRHVGGIVGFNEAAALIPDFYELLFDLDENINIIALVENNVNEGYVSAGYSQENIGGIVGWNLATSFSTDLLEELEDFPDNDGVLELIFDLFYEIENLNDVTFDQQIFTQAVINNNQNNAEVEAEYATNVGGIVGFNQATPPWATDGNIVNYYILLDAWDYDESASIPHAFFQGATVSNNLNTNDVYNDDGANTGGIVGRNAIASIVDDSFFAGIPLPPSILPNAGFAHVIDNSNEGSYVEGWYNAGGIVGLNQHLVSNVLNHASVYGYRNVGGIVGYNFAHTLFAPINIVFLYFSIFEDNYDEYEYLPDAYPVSPGIPSITGLASIISAINNGEAVYGYYNVGGIAGTNEAKTPNPFEFILDEIGYSEPFSVDAFFDIFYNIATIQSSTNNAEYVEGYENTGGVVGLNIVNEPAFMPIIDEFDISIPGMVQVNQAIVDVVSNSSTVYGSTNTGGIVGNNMVDLEFSPFDECGEECFFNSDLYFPFSQGSMENRVPDNMALIANSINKGTVIGNDGYEGDYQFTGGIAGQNTVQVTPFLFYFFEEIGLVNKAIIDGVVNEGEVYGDDFTGGIVGFTGLTLQLYEEAFFFNEDFEAFEILPIQTHVLNAVNLAKVEGFDYVGGIAGLNGMLTTIGEIDIASILGGEENPIPQEPFIPFLPDLNQIPFTITLSANHGEVYGTDYVGGLVGLNGGLLNNFGEYDLEYFFNSVQVALIQSENTGKVYGDDFVGGMVGLNEILTSFYAEYLGNGEEFVDFISPVAILQSFSIGHVNFDLLDGDEEESDSYYVGGGVGGNRGFVMDSYSLGHAFGTVSVGGFIGEHAGLAVNNYSIGIPIGEELVGGFIGDVHDGSILSNNFWNFETSGMINGLGNVGEPDILLGFYESKTTDELMTPATFIDAGWNLGEIWWINFNLSFPYHLWRYPTPPQTISGVAQGTGPFFDVELYHQGNQLPNTLGTYMNGFYYSILDNGTIPVGDVFMAVIFNGPIQSNLFGLPDGSTPDKDGNIVPFIGINDADLVDNTIIAQSEAGGIINHDAVIAAGQGLFPNFPDILFINSGSTMNLFPTVDFLDRINTPYSLNGSIVANTGTVSFLGALIAPNLGIIQQLTSGNVNILGGTFGPGSIIVQGGPGNNVLTIDFIGLGTLPQGDLFYNGSGIADFDTLTLQNGNLISIIHHLIDPNSGIIDLNNGNPLNGSLHYTGLEPILDGLGAINRSFNFIGGSAFENITLADALGVNSNFIDSTASESIVFANPLNTITISSLFGNDNIFILGVDPDFHGNVHFLSGNEADNYFLANTLNGFNLLIDGGSHFDTLSFLGNAVGLNIFGPGTIDGIQGIVPGFLVDFDNINIIVPFDDSFYFKLKGDNNLDDFGSDKAGFAYCSAVEDDSIFDEDINRKKRPDDCNTQLIVPTNIVPAI